MHRSADRFPARSIGLLDRRRRRPGDHNGQLRVATIARRGGPPLSPLPAGRPLLASFFLILYRFISGLLSVIDSSSIVGATRNLAFTFNVDWCRGAAQVARL